jgi:shikimate dehydrogenase
MPDHPVRIDGDPAPAAAATIRTGLIGCAIQASGSPAMHMAEAAELGLKLRYDLFDLDLRQGGTRAFATVLDEVQSNEYAGVNITHPCKQLALGFVQEVSKDARALGAINTIVFEGGRRIGHNTDWSGFAHSFQRGLPGTRIGRILQLGAGGAGSATAYALLIMGAGHLQLYDAAPGRAQQLCAQLAPLFGADRVSVAASIEGTLADCDGLVNSTPVGMAKYPGTPLPIRLLRPDLWVAEVVYFPLETELLRAARSLGCRVVDGGGMAVFQAAEAFRLFTGRQPDIERMLLAFRERLEQRDSSALADLHAIGVSAE